MAITRTETQITWPTASNTGSVSAGGNATSEEFNPDATCIGATLHLKAEYTAGSPAGDDIIYFWLLQTGGDPDGASSDEFDTPPQAASELGGAFLLAVLDLNKGETSGSGKMLKKSVRLPLPQKGAKLYAEGLTAGSSNTITVAATMTEQRAA